MCSFFICVWGWGGGGEVCPCFTAENWGQTLFKLGAWIENGDRPWLNIVLGLKKGQTLFKLNARIKKGGQTLFKLGAWIEKGDRPPFNPHYCIRQKNM